MPPEGASIPAGLQGAQLDCCLDASHPVDAQCQEHGARKRMSDPTVLGLGQDGSSAAARRSLPLSLPPRLVDTAVVVALGLLYAGYVTGNVLTLHGWTPHLVAVAAGAPTVLAFFWRRSRPLAVLAIACVAATFAAPVGTVPVLVALYTGLPACRSGEACWPGRP